jgi:hypothetical protein
VFRYYPQLEQQTKQWYPELDLINSRLSLYDSGYKFNQYPNHHPVKTIEGTGLAIINNVFFSFAKGERLEDQLAVECMDAWDTLYIQVVKPVVKEIFDRDSVELIFKFIDSSLMGLYFYWTSLCHEWGHAVGPYRIFPPTDGFLKLNLHLQGTFGETAANATAALLTPEYPEIALWILIFHIGFTGRKGFRADPTKGLINADNDTFAAILLYQRMIQSCVLEVTSNRKLHLNISPLLSCYAELRNEIDLLATEAFKLPQTECNQAFYKWLKGQIPFDGDDFIFPLDLKNLYAQVQTIPEYPHHLPLLPFLVN